MNERIKELAEQSGPNTIEELNADRTNVHVIDVKKFAELIVKECLMKVNGAKIRNESYDELIERIKEDFGVE